MEGGEVVSGISPIMMVEIRMIKGCFNGVLDRSISRQNSVIDPLKNASNDGCVI